jgi:hypothetical protein
LQVRRGKSAFAAVCGNSTVQKAPCGRWVPVENGWNQAVDATDLRYFVTPPQMGAKIQTVDYQ